MPLAYGGMKLIVRAANAYWEKKELDQAKRLFQAAIGLDPESELADGLKVTFMK